MTPRVDRYRLLQIVDSRPTAISKMATIVVVFLLVLGMSACSNESGVVDDKTTVTLSISTADAADAQTKGSTRADGTSSTAINDKTNKDFYISDLVVYIFNDAGDVIGENYGSYTLSSSNTITVKVATRKAAKCTIYAIANSGIVESTTKFKGISTKAEFDKQYHQLTTENNLNGTTSDGSPLPLIMFGELRGFDTTTSGKIPLKRLASKFDFTIKVDKDQGDAEDKWPIVIDSYQLKNVPMASYYVLPFWGDGTWNGDGNRDIPTGVDPQYGDYDAVTSVANTFTYYMYGNNAGKENVQGEAPDNATYLEIKAHAQVSDTEPTKVWESTYKVYLGGNTTTNTALTPGTPVASGGTYNGNFIVYPNVHYGITINIYGSGHSENGGLRVTYQAKPYFSSDGLDKWRDNDEDLDVKAKSKSSSGS